ncbi:MAG: SGNH/GDSL hydrolase family protein [Magnetospirillum sp.]|nr:SGNH/GDSL hydrolase family protein [Magnetospirillum sp.]
MNRFADISLLLITCLLVLAILEAALRLFPNSWQESYGYYAADGTTIRYAAVEGGLYRLQPEPAGRFQRPCFDITPIAVNKSGLRGSEWSTGTNGIAILGDSFVEALQVGEGETMADHLARRLGRPVWNVGVSGFSTLDELEAYRRWVAPLHPRHVVLALYLGNDISGNSCDLTKRKAGRCARTGDAAGVVAVAAPSPSPAPPAVTAPTAIDVKDWARRHLVLYQALHDLKLLVVGVLAQSEGRLAPHLGLYMPETADWQQAWAATAGALAELKQATAADGAQLLVVGIPEHFVTSPTGLTELARAGGTAIPDGFDPERPMRRLAAIAAAQGLDFLDLTPAFRSYRDRYALTRPAFSFRCDGHWNPLGHAVAAHAVAERLGAPRGAELPDPRTLLGDEAFRTIFEHGLYRGGALTGKVSP